MSSPIFGYFLTIISSLSTAILIIIGKDLTKTLDPIFIAGTIQLIGGVFIFTFICYQKGFGWIESLSKKGWKYTLYFSLLSIGYLMTYWVGISQAPASTVGFITRLETILLVLMGIIFLKERFSLVEIFCAFLVIVGVVIIKLSLTVEVTQGFWILVFCAIFGALSEFSGKKALRYIEPHYLSALRNIAVGVVMLAWSFIAGKASGGVKDNWQALTALVLLGPISARLTYLYALKYADISKVTLVSQIQPVFLVILAMSFLRENPSAKELAGGAIIIAGSVGVILARKMMSNLKNMTTIHKPFMSN